MVPQKRPALTTQLSGAVEIGAKAVVVVVVVVVLVVVVIDVIVVVVVVAGEGVEVVRDAVAGGEAVVVGTGGVIPPLGVRYQFATGSWRHSPAVTPVQPLALMRS